MLSNERSGSLFWNAPTGIPQNETGEYKGDALELLEKKWKQVPNANWITWYRRSSILFFPYVVLSLFLPLTSCRAYWEDYSQHQPAWI